MLTFFTYVLTIICAIAYSNVIEWIMHKHILHGLGKNKSSVWSFHWHQHHKKARKNNFHDEDYLDGWVGGPLREKLGLLLLLVAHSPLITASPVFFITLIYCSVRYYRLHKFAHLHPSWGRYYLKCHYDHHMGKNQDANWGVTISWVDKLFGTRIEHVGK